MNEPQVAYAWDGEWKIWTAVYEGTEIAGIEHSATGEIVTYGRGGERNRTFRTLDEAKRWIEENAGDLADSEVASEL